MSAPAFALTKIQPPRLRSSLIARPELEERLGAALAGARLTLISAPAGYGKTAALTRQIAQLPPGTAVAWVAVDEDDDLGRMAGCLVAALEPFDLPWRASPEALLLAMQDGGRPGRMAFASALLNALAATDVSRGLLLLDDVHRITDPLVFELLNSLVERLPEHWGMVMASRTEPPLPLLPRLRANGECVELHQDELGFTATDVRALIELRQGSATDEAVQSVHERTQGWPAGLGLVLSESRTRHGTPTGSLRDRHVFDYLASEVLDDMPAGLRAFLLRCSVLPELNAERCAAVSGDPQAAQWLEEIERRGLFASVLDSEAFTLRLHDLFRDCLDDRLRRESPQELPALLKRAADSEDDPVRRMGYLLRAGAWDAAEQLLGAMAPDLLTRGDTGLMLRLFGQFPPEHRERPLLQQVRAMASWGQWNLTAMREAALAAVAGYERAGDETGRLRALSYLAVAHSNLDDNELAQQTVDDLLARPLDDESLSRALLVASWLTLPRDTARLAALWSREMDTLQRINRLANWYECSPLPSFIGLPGMRPSLLRNVAGVQRCLPEQPVPLSGMIQITQGWLHLWDCEWDAVTRTLARAEADCRWLGQPTNLLWQLHQLKSLLCAMRGDVAGARAAADVLLDAVNALTDPGERAAYLARITHYAQRVAVVAGDTERVGELTARLLAHRGDPDWYLSPAFWRVVDAYAAHHFGRIDEACALWTQVLGDEVRVHIFGQSMEMRLLLAAAHVEAQRLDAAVETLRPALQRMQAGGEHGMALTAGPRALQTLAGAAWGGRLAPHEQQVLAQWLTAVQALRGRPGPAAETAASAGAAADTLLSPREFEVLQRIAAGDSNKLIARAFDLSPHTVKRHVANILDKLGVASRGQAAAWALARH
ncbi:MAG TPA: LuxR C-terminal-related transcriptional regulator [Rhizobacter sp.]|nr:LuxR C-terminal-related transcriptional regulator [Rhizobacter sp.]